MNILVTGANGQLENEIKEISRMCEKHRFFYTDVNSVADEYLDITHEESVKEFISDNKINIVINCAAYTNVETASVAKDSLCGVLNAYGPRNLAVAIKERNGLLIHISTDYVFRGTKNTPYTEEDAVGPINDYGSSKLLGEALINSCNEKTIIIRTSWLYSIYGKNFVKTIINKLHNKNEELKIVDDQIGSPTYANDLAKAIIVIIDHYTNGTATYGIYHYSNDGVCTWYEFAKAIAEYSGLDELPNIKPCESSEFSSKVVRPHYSVLSKKKIMREFRVVVPYWRDSLKKCINKLLNEDL